MKEFIEKMVEGKPLVMFGKSGCPMCHSVKTLLSDFGANLTVYELDRLNNGLLIETLLRHGGSGLVPAVFIGQKLVGGAEAVMTLHLQNKLAPMLIAAGAIFFWHNNQTRL